MNELTILRAASVAANWPRLSAVRARTRSPMNRKRISLSSGRILFRHAAAPSRRSTGLISHRRVQFALHLR